MPRSVETWVAAHDDQAIPIRVKRRILKRQCNADGVPVCPDCGTEIRPDVTPEFDHALPLADHGTHSEDNLRAIHPKCHKLKTAREAHRRAEERSQFDAMYGLKNRPARGGFQTNRNGKFKKKMNGQVVLRTQ